MRKTFALIAVIGSASLAAFSQDSGTALGETTYEQCVAFYKTPPLRDLLKTVEPVDDEALSLNAQPQPIRESRYGNPDELDMTLEEDPAIQSTNGTNNSGGYRMAVNFQGQFGGFPPDPSGAAGPNHFVQAVNGTYRIYDKEGNPETPPYALNSIWDHDHERDTDPIIMYDKFAQRWFISYMYFNESFTDNGVLIAVSQTSDPLGEYYLYVFDYTLLPDYPKYSVWSNAYFMSANSTAANCSAFDREKMLVGDPTAGVIKMSFPPMYLLFNSLAPTYAEGPTAPDDDEPCYFFAVQDNAFPGVTTDHIKILRAEINWDAPTSSNIFEHQELNTAAFNAVFSGGFSENLAQQGTTQRLDAIQGIFMYRAQYRRFPGYNVVMLCNTVNTGGNRAGMRWYELRDNDDGNWYIYQQGTYAPDSENSRWLGNLAMDRIGNIAMAYSFAGPSHYAGIRYTGRFHHDPLGEMTVPEHVAIAGEGAQTGGGRYGDYSQMSMDPNDDHTFWFTGEWLGSGGSRRTRVFSFSSWHLANLDEEQKALLANLNAYQPSPGLLQLEWSDLIEEDITIRVIDASGRFITQEPLVHGSDGQLIELPTNANGIFIVSLIGEKTNLNKKVYIGR